MTIPPTDPAGTAGDPAASAANHEASDLRGTSAAQLRRFIKSRPYVPLHELRRRFELNGQPDDVCPLQTPDGTVFLGLPPRECELLGELLRTGEIGLELCHDPLAPIAVGVFPMRPVIR